MTSLKLAGTETIFFLHCFVLFNIQTTEIYALKHKMIAQKRKKRPYLTNQHEKIECSNNNPTDFKSIKQNTKISLLTITGLSGGWLPSILLF